MENEKRKAADVSAAIMEIAKINLPGGVWEKLAAIQDDMFKLCSFYALKNFGLKYEKSVAYAKDSNKRMQEQFASAAAGVIYNAFMNSSIWESVAEGIEKNGGTKCLTHKNLTAI